MQKSYQQKSDRKTEFFYFYYCMHQFFAYNFFGVNIFAFFSTNSKSASNFVFYGTQIEFLQNIRLIYISIFLLILNRNADVTDEEKN